MHNSPRAGKRLRLSPLLRGGPSRCSGLGRPPGALGGSGCSRCQNTLSGPLFDLGFHPCHRARSKLNRRGKAICADQSVEARLRETSDQLHVRQTQEADFVRRTWKGRVATVDLHGSRGLLQRDIGIGHQAGLQGHERQPSVILPLRGASRPILNCHGIPCSKRMDHSSNDCRVAS